MSRRHLTLIVAMSLAMVIIITQTLLLTSFSNNKAKEIQDEIALEIPIEHQKEIPQGEPTIEEQESITPEQDSGIEVGLEEQEADSVLPESQHQNNITNPAPVQNNPSSRQDPVTVVRENKKLNSQTNNTNILCVGIADKNLEMISIYSINKDNKKSAGIFLPTRTSLRINGELLTLADIYQKFGILTLKKALSQSLLIDIPYHMIADQKGLEELSELIGPLYVENEEIDIPNLFVRPVSDKDDVILQSLADQITQPRMVLQVPRLIRIFINNVQSDIGVNGLWELYRVFSQLNHSELGKVVLWGQQVTMADRTYWFIDPYDWQNIIYKMTVSE